MAKVRSITTLTQLTPAIRREVSKYWDNNGRGDEDVKRVANMYGMSIHIARHLLELDELAWRKRAVKLAAAGNIAEAREWSWIPEKRILADLERVKHGLPLYPVSIERECDGCGAGTVEGPNKCEC